MSGAFPQPQLEALHQMLLEETSQHADTRARFIAAVAQLNAATQRAEAAEKALEELKRGDAKVIELHPPASEADEFGQTG